MSEPDFRIGVDEELVSSLEALHEDLYFVTLDFFDALGRTTTQAPPGRAGQDLPDHPSRAAGQAGRGRACSTPATRRRKPKLEISYKEKGVEQPTRVIARPRRRSTRRRRRRCAPWSRADRVSEIELAGRGEGRPRSRRARPTRSTRSARLHAAGLYHDALSFDHVDRVAVTVGLKDARARRVIATTGAFAAVERAARGRPRRNADAAARDVGSRHQPRRARGDRRQARGVPRGQGLQGGAVVSRPRHLGDGDHAADAERAGVAGEADGVQADDLHHRPPARQRGVVDEPHPAARRSCSSPTRPTRTILKKVNVILHPVENPDGAQMAFELQKLTPTHMLHAGRYSALGMDVASQVGLADPLLPEALVRGARVARLAARHLPEPARLSVARVGAAVRRLRAARVPHLSVDARLVHDDRQRCAIRAIPITPRRPTALREAIVREINANPDVRAMDLRAPGALPQAGRTASRRTSSTRRSTRTRRSTTATRKPASRAAAGGSAPAAAAIRRRRRRRRRRRAGSR